MVALVGGPSPGQAQEQKEGEPYEVLANGPVHEAYANPLDYKPQLGPVVPKEPPAAIEEVAPEQKPEGNDVEWIPGYWWWDEEEKGFFWVSGFWRDMPPDRRWVPGAWQAVEDGWQWSPGFWASEQEKEIPYVPDPPESIDAGPSVPPPDATSIYVPGCWMWRETRFAWRPGYWLGYRPGWVYIPAHFVRTCGGCVFVEGYWDYPLHTRGLLFAPIRFDRGVVVRSFMPSHVVRNDFLMLSLYVAPHRQHYYFGNYASDAYQRRGFVAWTDYRPNRRSVDPDYSYYRSTYREDPMWELSVVAYYKGRGSADAVEAPHTYRQQQKVIEQLQTSKKDSAPVVKDVNITTLQSVSAITTLKEVTQTKVTGLATLAPKAKVQDVERTIKLKEVGKEEHTQRQKNAQTYHELAKQRQQIEAKLLQQGGVPATPPAKEQPKPTRLDLPKGPERERPKTQVQPPPPPPAPKLQENVTPKFDPPKQPKPRPTQPDNKPMQPEKPRPSDKPVQPDNKPVQPEKPKPSDKPAQPENKPVQPEKPRPDNKPVQPEKPRPSDKPAKPENKPAQPETPKPVPMPTPKPPDKPAKPESKPVQPPPNPVPTPTPKPPDKPDNKPAKPDNKPKPSDKPAKFGKPK